MLMFCVFVCLSIAWLWFGGPVKSVLIWWGVWLCTVIVHTLYMGIKTMPFYKFGAGIGRMCAADLKTCQHAHPEWTRKRQYIKAISMRPGWSEDRARMMVEAWLESRLENDDEALAFAKVVTMVADAELKEGMGVEPTQLSKLERERLETGIRMLVPRER